MAAFIETWLGLSWAAQLYNILWLGIALSFVVAVVFFVVRIIRGSIKEAEIGDVKIKTRDAAGEEKVEVVEKVIEVPVPVAAVTEERVDDEMKETLLKHRFFSTMASYQAPGVLGIDTKTVRGAIAYTFLVECKFKVFEEGMMQFLKSCEKGYNSLYNLNDKIGELINEYNVLAARTPVTLPDGNVLPYIPKSFLAIFNKWHSKHVQMTLFSISYVLSARYGRDWQERANTCLEILALSFDYTAIETIDAFEQLNGDLDKEVACMLGLPSYSTHECEEVGKDI